MTGGSLGFGLLNPKINGQILILFSIKYIDNVVVYMRRCLFAAALAAMAKRTAASGASRSPVGALP
jgi:uncharacterized membrane protein